MPSLEPEPRAAARAPASAWFALAVLIVATVVGAVDKTIFTLLTEPVRHSLSLSDTQIGAIQGLGVALFTGLATFPLGWLSDRYDRRWVLAACVIFWSGMTALRGLAPDYGWLLVASVGLGVGEAGLAPVINSLLPDLFARAQRVVANAVYVLASIFGAALGAVLSGAAVGAADALRPHLPAALAGAETWRLTFFLVALVGLPLALLILAMRAAPRSAGEPAAATPTAPTRTFGDYLRSNWRTLAGLVAGTGLGGLGLNGIGIWIPVHAARHFGLAPAQVGQYLGASLLGGTVLGALIGVLALRAAQRRLGAGAAMRLLTIGYLCAALASLTMLFATSTAGLFASMALVIMPLMAALIVLPNALQDAAPAALRGRAMAAFAVGQLFFASLAPLGIGMLSDAVHDRAPDSLVIALVAVTLVCGLAGALLLWRTEDSFTRLTLANRA